MHNRLNDDHFENCHEACCGNFETGEPDYTPTMGSSEEPRKKLYGRISVEFKLASDSATLMNVAVRYSIDGGRSFNRCTPAEDSISLRRLPSCLDGIKHEFIWASAADLPGKHEQVHIMVLVLDGKNGCVFDPIAIDNTEMVDEDSEGDGETWRLR